MTALHPLRPSQLAAEAQGNIHRDFSRWLNRLATVVNLWTPPPKTVITVALTADDVASSFDATGLGLAGRAYAGWAICNGSNDTPDLRNRFVRLVATASGTTGGADTKNTGAGTAHSHGSSQLAALHEVAAGDTWIREKLATSNTWEATHTTTTPAWIADSSDRTQGLEIIGSSDAESAHTHSVDVRPAYHELVPLMRVEQNL